MLHALRIGDNFFCEYRYTVSPVAWIEEMGSLVHVVPEEYAGILMEVKPIGDHAGQSRTCIRLDFNVLDYMSLGALCFNSAGGDGAAMTHAVAWNGWREEPLRFSDDNAPLESQEEALKCEGPNLIHEFRHTDNLTYAYKYPLPFRTVGTPFAFAVDILTSPHQLLATLVFGAMMPACCIDQDFIAV